tara:strand:+ start:1455 stop:1745 length:291 start_codon:yes stop_codon:yes gene_type:complete
LFIKETIKTMKPFFVKTIIIFIATLLIYNLTIGNEIKKFENMLSNITNKTQREQIKEKILLEMSEANKKDNYFTDEEKSIISNFLKKILTELDLKK